MKAGLRSLSPHTLAAAAFRLRELGIFVALGATVLFFSVRATNFATIGNWQDIATDVALVAAVAVGETMVVLTRNIDLSVGSVVGLTAYLSSNTLADHHGIPIAVIALLAIAIGAAAGLVNGLLVTVGRIPSIIATLATLSVYRGLDFELTRGQNVSAYELPQRFLDFAAKKPLGIPVLAWIVIAAFVISGALAGLGGFMFAARFASVDAVAGRGFELDVVTAVVIGGVNVFGGVGTVLGAVLGAVLVATIQDGFTLLRLSEFWKIFFNGAAIVVAVALDALVTQRLQEALRRRRRAEVLATRERGAEA